jgi:hypothetical protein
MSTPRPLPLNLPDLPNDDGQRWSANVRRAHQILGDVYEHATTLLQREDSDPLQLSFHINAIMSDAIPLLSSMEQDGISAGMPLPDAWLQTCAERFGETVVQLRHIRALASGQ